MTLNFRTKKSKAFGLVEVLVSIAISAIIMIGAVQVAAKGWQAVRESELRDTASGVLLRSLEVSRSPVDFELNKKLSPSQKTEYFRIIINSEGELDLEATASGSGVDGEIEDCDSSDSYKIQEVYDGVEYPFDICNQVIVSRIDNPNTSEDLPDGTVQQTFEIKSIVVYTFKEEAKKDTLISYRTEVYDEV